MRQPGSLQLLEGDAMKPARWNQWRLVKHYLHLQLLPPGVVDEEWKTVFPQRLLGLEPDLYRETGSRLLVFNQKKLESSRGKLIRQCYTWKQYHIIAINTLILSACYSFIGGISGICITQHISVYLAVALTSHHKACEKQAKRWRLDRPGTAGLGRGLWLIRVFTYLAGPYLKTVREQALTSLSWV